MLLVLAFPKNCRRTSSRRPVQSSLEVCPVKKIARAATESQFLFAIFRPAYPAYFSLACADRARDGQPNFTLRGSTSNRNNTLSTKERHACVSCAFGPPRAGRRRKTLFTHSRSILANEPGYAIVAATEPRIRARSFDRRTSLLRYTGGARIHSTPGR